MRGFGGMTEALDSLIGSAGLQIEPWTIPAVLVVGFLFLLPQIKQNQRTNLARQRIRELAHDGGANSDKEHAALLALSKNHPITLVVIADEAHRRGMLSLTKKATFALEQTGKRTSDVHRLRLLLNGPAPTHPESEIAIIEKLVSQGLIPLAQNRLERALQYWPSNTRLHELSDQMAIEE
ncbi:MAG: hypothetical protein CL930_09485 [Deltaproteobacteria bacterium]|nr:hypothetical protein [Deltaproteobacteria bacterium]